VDDDEADGMRDGLFMEALIGDDPEATLHDIVVELHSNSDPSEHFVMMIGIGPLETLLHQGHGELLWPQMEKLARDDPLFRRALASAWAYDSPEYERRRQLLVELGEVELD
jgi:hypothetical protein